ncbi:GntR family transcriptional regulator [Kutzneria buriramensis]|uniref:DNA-binding GntR family transcriptional regulator n=1 Tax=Kutzneria buriramensis TaxID=1045776 RepID=A0A3E0I522_9PSEU|nr:GntR family transcriptional regulator [Kutzneria buriramensis]REH53858.1 DNA-binding GntR family transcriptional regulator [Kutzneria buriramensis]
MATSGAGVTRTDGVHARLREDILGGVLSPGQRLKFPELCRRYDTSVGAAREALTRLASAGLVRSQAHQGYVVTPLSVDDLAELTVARVQIECLVLRMSVSDGDVRWEANAIAAHHLLERAPYLDPDNPARSTADWAAAHAAFHEALLAGCANRRLREVAIGLRDEAELYRQWSITPAKAKGRDVAAEHRAILEASIARDVDVAVRLLGEHISTTSKLLIDSAVE